MKTKSPDFDIADVRHVLQEHELKDFLSVLEQHEGYVVLDLETTGLNEYWEHARVVTLAVTLPIIGEESREELAPPLTYVVGLSHPDAPLHANWRVWLERIVRVLWRRRHEIIGQNIRFDVRWLTALTGHNLSAQIVADTGMSSHLMDENQTASLKPRAMATFGIESWIDFDWGVIDSQQRKDPRYPFCPLLAERVPYFVMALYNARDTYWTWRLHQHHERQMGMVPDWRDELLSVGDRDSMNDLRLGTYYQTLSVPAIRTLTDMEQQGMLLDIEWCNSRLVELANIVREKLTDLHALTEEALAEMGVWWMESEVSLEHWENLKKSEASFEPTALYFKAWAAIMCASGRLRMLSITKKGVPSWTKAVLNRLSRMDFPAAVALLEYRKASKEGQFIRSWLELADEHGRLHPTFNYYRVVTGRLSSSNPNAQQIPRGTKNAFIASPGYVLVTADYSQIEMRVAAFLANCKPMIEAFKRGEDLHRIMASVMAKCDPADVTPEQRQGAKAGNFGFLFSMGSDKFVTYADETYGVMFTHEEAADIRSAFFETWEGMQEWHDKQRKDAHEFGYVRSPLGRLRRLPNIWGGDNYRIGEAERQAINSPVQGMASDMMLLAASRIRKHFPQIRPVALVHDAILCEVPEGQAADLAAAIKSIMENIHTELAKLGCNFTVPLVADVAVGKSWGACIGV